MNQKPITSRITAASKNIFMANSLDQRYLRLDSEEEIFYRVWIHDDGSISMRKISDYGEGFEIYDRDTISVSEREFNDNFIDEISYNRNKKISKIRCQIN